jgi:hypothetical protein
MISMTAVTIAQQAPDHSTFAPDCFDSQIGKTIPLKIEGRQIDDCKILGAETSEDGTEVFLTLELPSSVKFPLLSDLSIYEG